MALFIPIAAVAARYDTSRYTIYRWLRDDPAFPKPIKMPSGSQRWSVAALEQWEAERLAAVA